MLMMAWSENKSGARSRPGAPQEGVPVRLKPYCDEGIVRRASEASSPQNERLSPAEDFDEGIVRHAEPVETEARHAVAMENATAPAKERLSPAPHVTGARACNPNPIDTSANRLAARNTPTTKSSALQPAY